MTAVELPVLSSRLGSLGVHLVPSPLSERLAQHADALRAFRAARQSFVVGERIDLSALAAALGVDRASLCRWVGNRDACSGRSGGVRRRPPSTRRTPRSTEPGPTASPAS